MGKIAAASFVLSSLSLLNQAGLLQGKGNFTIVIVTLVWSTLQFSYDIYLFVVNPYSFKQKAVDLALSTLLGGLYEENRTKWSFKWLHCFCNPFVADFYVYNSYHYLMLMKKGESDNRKWSNVTNVYRHALEGPGNAEQVDTHVEIYANLDDWQHQWTPVHHLWELANYGNSHLGKIEYMKRYFTVKDKTVRVVVQTDWISRFLYDVKISESHSTQILVEYEGSSENLGCVINLYAAWAWFSRQPGCGVVDCRKGGLHRGSKFLHTVDLGYMHTALASCHYDLYVCQHEDHGFYVAGP